MNSSDTVSIERDALLKFLKENEYDAHDKPEQGQILVNIKVDKYDFPLYLHPFLDGELIQIITFIPCRVEEESFPDLARLLHLLNKDMDMPGLCMDEPSKSVFYRCMAPAFGKVMLKSALFAYLNTSHNVVNAFAPVIAAIGSGKVSYDDVVKTNQTLAQDETLISEDSEKIVKLPNEPS